MKKEDLQYLEGKDISEVISFANKLFEENIEGKKKHIISTILVWKKFQMFIHINIQRAEVF